MGRAAIRAGPLFGVFDITSYVVTISDTGLSSIGAHIEATQAGTLIVPEPAAGLLVGMGLACVAAGARRRRVRGWRWRR